MKFKNFYLDFVSKVAFGDASAINLEDSVQKRICRVRIQETNLKKNLFQYLISKVLSWFL